jgi:uncharacterized membrane protein YdbT with pleckstrin-like domain
MTAGLEPAPRGPALAQAQAPGRSGGGVELAVPHALPTHWLDGGEVVHFAIKPSLWFVPLVSVRWLLAGVLLVAYADSRWIPTGSEWYVTQLGVWLAVARLAWATLEWVSRLYVLTNRRMMRVRGVFNVELFECALDRIQDVHLTASLGERLTRVATITVETAGTIGRGSWKMVAHPIEVHGKLREAVYRARSRGQHAA